MPTITRAALQYIEDQLEERDAQIDELEEELAQALEDNAEKEELISALRATIQRLMTDRSMAV